MAVYFATGDERIGSLRIIKSIEHHDPNTHQTHRTPPLVLKLTRAWGTGKEATPDGVLVETARAGPDIIDTDDLSGENLHKCKAKWPDEEIMKKGPDGKLKGTGEFRSVWKSKLEAWLKTVGVEDYRLEEGDPRPKQRFKVGMTKAEYDDWMKSQDKKPVDIPVPTTAQKVTTGAIGTKS